MDTTNIPEEIDYRRRYFFGAAAATVAAAQLVGITAAGAQTGGSGRRTPPTGASAPFTSLKQIDAGVVNVGYAQTGPADGPAVILLHGWPYDIDSFTDVAPLLASAGYRVIVPICAARVRRASSPAIRSATVSPPQWRSTPSP